MVCSFYKVNEQYGRENIVMKKCLICAQIYKSYAGLLPGNRFNP